MPSEVNEADEDAKLLVEAFCLGQTDSSIWEAYMNGWMNNVRKRIADRFPDAGPHGGGPSNPGPIDPVPGG